jgi:hypothetical protein
MGRAIGSTAARPGSPRVPELVDSARSGAFCSSLPSFDKNTFNDGRLGVFQDGSGQELVHSAPLRGP